MTQGKVLIELFDGQTGAKQAESRDTNFIAKGVKHLMRDQMRDVFTRNRYTGGFKMGERLDPFSEISLTGDDSPESPSTEWLPEVKRVGFAYSDGIYSGADTQRGSYNMAESFTRGDKVRMVFDFPTHAANGVIKSVCFHNKWGTAVPFATVHRTPMIGKKIIESGGFYYTSDGWKIRKYDKNYNLVAERTQNHFDFEVIGDKLIYSYGDMRLYRLPLGTFDTSVVENIDMPFSVSSLFQKRGMLYATGRTSGKQLVEIDSVTLAEISVVSPTLDIYNNYPMLSVDSSVFARGALLNSDFKTNKIMFSSYTISPAGNAGPEHYFITDGTSLYKVPKIFLGSRSLLTAPVTKTATQTMKVTYDFILPDLYEPIV